MSYYSYGNRIYSLNEAKKEAKNEKGKDIHIIAALKAEIKNCKNASEKKKLTAKLMKYTQKALNEGVASGMEEKALMVFLITLIKIIKNNHKEAFPAVLDAMSQAYKSAPDMLKGTLELIMKEVRQASSQSSGEDFLRQQHREDTRSR
jgi:hypothetical protein